MRHGLKFPVSKLICRKEGNQDGLWFGQVIGPSMFNDQYNDFSSRKLGACRNPLVPLPSKANAPKTKEIQ